MKVTRHLAQQNWTLQHGKCEREGALLYVGEDGYNACRRCFDLCNEQRLLAKGVWSVVVFWCVSGPTFFWDASCCNIATLSGSYPAFRTCSSTWTQHVCFIVGASQRKRLMSCLSISGPNQSTYGAPSRSTRKCLRMSTSSYTRRRVHDLMGFWCFCLSKVTLKGSNKHGVLSLFKQRDSTLDPEFKYGGLVFWLCSPAPDLPQRIQRYVPVWPTSINFLQ